MVQKFAMVKLEKEVHGTQKSENIFNYIWTITSIWKKYIGIKIWAQVKQLKNLTGAKPDRLDLTENKPEKLLTKASTFY